MPRGRKGGARMIQTPRTKDREGERERERERERRRGNKGIVVKHGF